MNTVAAVASRWTAILLLGLAGGCATRPPKAVPAALAQPAPAARINPTFIRAMPVPDGAIGPGSRAVAAPLAGGLKFACLVGPGPEAPLLRESDLPALGLDRDGALALAAANVAAGLRPMSAVVRELAPGEVGTIRGDFGEAGRLIDHAEWAPLARSMGGNLLVSAPAADTLLYTRGGVPGALGSISDMARALMSSSQRPISDAVLRWTPAGWSVIAGASAPAS